MVFVLVKQSSILIPSFSIYYTICPVMLFSGKFNLDKAFTYSAKVAYLARLLKSEANQIQRFAVDNEVMNLLIEQPHNTKLNKLKKPYPDAFWYWWLATKGK